MVTGDEARRLAEMFWRLNPQGEVRISGGGCYAKAFFTVEEDANAADADLRRRGATVNGGWFDGMPLGRYPSDDYTDDAGVRWYAIWH